MAAEFPHLGTTNELLIAVKAMQEGAEDSQDRVEVHNPKDYLDDL